MMKRVLTAVALCAGLAFGQSASAVVLLDENFDSETPSVLNYDSFANWDVVNGTVDTVGSGGFGITCPGGTGVCIDLDGSTSNAGDLISKTSFNFSSGETIHLAFDFSGNQRNTALDTFSVSLGGFFSETFSDIPGGQGFQTVIRSFSSGAGGSANLQFSNEGGDNFGVILDNVKLESSPDAVIPAPPALVLLSSAVGLALWRARRSQKG